MLSVYFHAHGERYSQSEDLILVSRELEAQIPARLRPMPLEPALALLEADDSEHRRANQVRAAAKLAGARIFPSPNGELERILGADPDAIPRVVGSRLQIEDWIYQQEDLVIQGTGDAPSCRRREPCVHAVWDPQTDITDLTVSIEVGRTLGEMNETMDPQNWARCSDFFERTHIAAHASKKGERPTLPKRSRSYEVPPADRSPSSGTAWHGLLYEHFVIHWNLYFRSSLQNLLWIDRTATGSNQVGMEYGLRACLASELLADFQSGGLDLDDGATGARELPQSGQTGTDRGPWTETWAKKRIRFTHRKNGSGFERLINRLLPWLYVTFMEGELHNTACCRVGSRSEPERKEFPVANHPAAPIIDFYRRWWNAQIDWWEACYRPPSSGGGFPATVHGPIDPITWWWSEVAHWCGSPPARSPFPQEDVPTVSFVFDETSSTVDPVSVPLPIQPRKVQCLLGNAEGKASPECLVAHAIDGNLEVRLDALDKLKPGAYVGVVYEDTNGPKPPLAVVHVWKMPASGTSSDAKTERFP